ncbi:MAG TPA: DegT/DnrJ/EryC1/StrS family aminotransferase [Chthonomonadaceae bacterium]|nr:DegT/DnrJ/EryC1/StrS family aminotransferase [Chthonomonadaceae bacterium]
MSWTVRYIDYPTQFRNMEAEIMDTIHTVLSKGDLMLRQQLRDFENNLAQFVGTSYAVGTSNCTDALHLTLRAAGIGPGDEVISVAHTFVATIAAIHHAGGTPILVDIGDDHNMDVSKVEAAITPRTKAILPVHLNGRLCDMEALSAIARKHNLLVIEDTAQALGGSVDGKKGGNWGLAGCFSFYPAKLLGAFGDAGAVVTNSEEIAQKVRQLRDHGRMPNGDLAGWSFNCRMDNLHAALLDLKLKRLPEWLGRRRALARLYHERLSGIEQLRLPPPPETNGRYHDVFQNYEIEAEDRDGLVAHLKASGVETMLPWGGRAVHQFPALGLSHFRLPRTEELFRKVLMLPMHPELQDSQIDYVAEAIRRFYNA